MKPIVTFIFTLFSLVFCALTVQAKPIYSNILIDGNQISANKILLVVAMSKEALPIIGKLNLKKLPDVFSGLPMQSYTGTYANKEIFLITNGQDPQYKVDNVATQPAVLATYLGITYFHPDLVISIGTAGGIVENGAHPNDIYVSQKIYFFDRRIGGEHTQYGFGGYSSPDVAEIANKIHLKKGMICTGNSFDLSPTDKAIIQKNKCAAEEMEAASVAWVSMLMKTPMLAIKGIGNIAGDENNHRDYIANGTHICNKIAEAASDFIKYLPNKPLPTKEEFTDREIVKGLDLQKSILDQQGMMLNYMDQGIKQSVPAKHDMITLFKINNEYYVLGQAIKNPVADHPTELKVSIGGTNKANYAVSLGESLDKEMAVETQHKLPLSEFDISPYHVTSRQPNWGEWSVCFLEIIGVSKSITHLDELKRKVAAINEGANFSYGIYKLDEVIQAATKTAGVAEGSGKEKTLLKNYFNSTSERLVIFNDNDLAMLFSQLKPDQLFAAGNKL